MPTKTWDATDGVLASTDANWVGGVKPVVGDNILFDATSGADNCTMDLALALSSLTMTADYSGTITQTASFSVTGYSQAAGTFTGSTSHTLSCSGNFIKTGGTVTGNVLKLTMTGDGTTVTGIANIYVLTANANCTLTTTTEIRYSLVIAITKTLTLAAGTVNWQDTWTGGVFTNAGTLAGPGTYSFLFHNADMTVTPGTLTCNIVVEAWPSATRDNILILAGPLITTGTLQVESQHAAWTMTLDPTAGNYDISAAGITVLVRGIINGRASIISCVGTFDSSAGTFTQGTSTLITGANGNLKLAAAGCYNLRVAEGVTTTLTAALNVYKDLRVIGTLTRGANTVSLLGAGEQTVSGYPDTAITVNSTGPIIFHECSHDAADVTFTAGTCVWTGYGKYITRGNLSISAISRKPNPFTDVQNLNGTLTLDAEARMKDLITDAGQTTVQSAGVQLGISGKIATAGTFTQNTPTKIVRARDIADSIPFPVQFCVNQPKGWGDA